jgi:hypothetical protein
MLPSEEKKRFDEANRKVHAVEDQWHYKYMTEFGFVPLDKTGVGFVRTYRYEHPKTKHRINVTTGFNSDYWDDQNTGDYGYHLDLAPHLKKITNNP